MGILCYAQSTVSIAKPIKSYVDIEVHEDIADAVWDNGSGCNKQGPEVQAAVVLERREDEGKQFDSMVQREGGTASHGQRMDHHCRRVEFRMRVKVRCTILVVSGLLPMI